MNQYLYRALQFYLNLSIFVEGFIIYEVHSHILSHLSPKIILRRREGRYYHPRFTDENTAFSTTWSSLWLKREDSTNNRMSSKVD